MKFAHKKITGTLALIFGCHFFVASTVLALPASEGLALTPPMGWNSCNYFGCWAGHPSLPPIEWSRPGGGITDKKTLQQARAMCAPNNIPGSANFGVSMKDCGYKYVNLDDCYLQHDRDANGGLVAKQATFPMGIKALGDSVRTLGLKFGVYTDAFSYSCADVYEGFHAGQPGMWGHEQQDADTFVAWGVEFVKVDFCGYEAYLKNLPTEQQRIDSTAKIYSRIGKAFKTAVAKARSQGKPAKDILFSICEWGYNKPYLWGDSVGHMWRILNDLPKSYTKVMNQVPWMLKYADSSGPGGWNDPDMLQVGNLLTDNMSKVHFCLWSILPAPMIAGNDLTNMTPLVKNLFTNQDIARVNQDPLGKPARLVKGIPSDTGTFVLAKELVDGNFAVLFVNNAQRQNMSVTMDEISQAITKKNYAGKDFRVYDLHDRKMLGSFSGSFETTVNSIDCFFCIVEPGDNSKSRTTLKESKTLDFTISVSSTHITINSAFKNPSSIKLVNLKGNVLHNVTVNKVENHSIPLKNIGRGIYFLSMKSFERGITMQVIVR